MHDTLVADARNLTCYQLPAVPKPDDPLPRQQSLTPFVSCAQVLMLHSAAFAAGYYLAHFTIAQDSVALARCISLESGMQVRASSNR